MLPGRLEDACVKLGAAGFSFVDAAGLYTVGFRTSTGDSPRLEMLRTEKRSDRVDAESLWLGATSPFSRRKMPLGHEI